MARLNLVTHFSTFREGVSMANVEQGELFTGFIRLPSEKPNDNSHKSATKHKDVPQQKAYSTLTYTKPKKHFTYNEYKKIFCGNSAAAEYWWKKDMQRLEEEQRCGHTE